MCLPALTQYLGATEAVMRTQRYPEQISQLTVEVPDAGLRPRERSDMHVAYCGELLGEHAQGGGLVGSDSARHEGKTTLANELLDAPTEGLDARRALQSFNRDLR